MFGIKILIDKLNEAIDTETLTELQLTQAFGAIESLEKQGVASVATLLDLPNPVTNKGRFFWVDSEKKYVLSNGITWDINNILTTVDVNLYAWGQGFLFGLPTNSSANSLEPVQAVGTFTDWVGVSNYRNGFALRADGTLWSWGQNNRGSLGINASGGRSSPVSVVGGFTDWVQVSAGETATLALRADGTAWGWGGGSYGVLGNNSGVYRSSPVSVVGGFTDWTQLSTRIYTSSGVRANGTIWSWGRNDIGQLGVDNTANTSSPVSVIGGFTDWVQTSTGPKHIIAIRSNGTAWAWGRNYSGMLGDGTILHRSSTVSVVGGFTDWAQVSAGRSHNIAIRADGSAWAWGQDNVGQLAQNSYRNRSSPVSVVGGFTDWVIANTGADHTIALRANGTAWGWGLNAGRLGDEASPNRSSPVSVVGGFTDWVSVSAGLISSLGVRG